jgi:hypothetical protein
MIFTIIILALLAAIVFFHYIQGFFSATLSAILAAISAVLAFAYHETVVEKFLAGKAADYAHAMVLVGMFVVIYLVLRTLFDAAVPGNVRVPAVVDKIGGGVMGLVAALFATGVVAVAAQELPFSAAVGGYAKYETKNRLVVIPGKELSSRRLNAQVEDELVGGRFDEQRRKSLFPPVDDLLVNTVERLSAPGGALSAGQPLTDLHPDFLQELFGQRAGVQFKGGHVAINSDRQQMVQVEGLYLIDSVPKVSPHDFKTIHEAATTPKAPFKAAPGQALVVIRVVFKQDAADADRVVRLSPGGVRLAAFRNGGPDGTERANYYPVGTLQGSDLIYTHHVDDFLFLDVREGDGAADFVFQVDPRGFFEGGAAGGEAVQRGVFLEVKRMARIELGGKQVAKRLQPSEHLALIRKELQRDGGQPPPLKQIQASTSGGGTIQSVRELLQGTWEGTSENRRTVKAQIDTADITIDVKTAVVNTTEQFKGNWNPNSLNGSNVIIHVDMKSAQGKQVVEEPVVKVEGNDKITITFKDPAVLGQENQSVTLTRTAGASGK